MNAERYLLLGYFVSILLLWGDVVFVWIASRTLRRRESDRAARRGYDPPSLHPDAQGADR